MAASRAYPPWILDCPDGGEVSSVQINAEGSVVATAWTRQNTIKLWDVSSGQLIRTLEGHSGPVRAMSFSMDGTMLVSGADDKSIKLWDIPTGQEVRTFKGHQEPVIALHISPRGNRMASADASRLAVVKMWDLATGEHLSTVNYGVADIVTGLQFNPIGDHLVVFSNTALPIIFDASNGQLCVKVRLRRCCPAVCWSSNGDSLVAGGQDGSLSIIDSETGDTVWMEEGPHQSSISFVQYCCGGNRIISASEGNGMVKVWDAQLGVVVSSLQCPTWSLRAMHVPATLGDRLVCLSRNRRQVQIWILGLGMVLPIPMIEEDDGYPAICMIISPDCSRLVSGTKYGIINIWDTTTKKGTAIDEWAGGDSGSPAPPQIEVLYWSENGKRLAASSSDGRLAVWNVKTTTAQLLRTFEGQSGENASTSLFISCIGNDLISGGRDGMVKVWNMTTGQCFLTLQGHKGQVKAVGMSQDGEHIASGSSDGTIRIWDSQCGACLHTLKACSEGAVTALCFRKDRLWSGDEAGRLTMWEASTGRMIGSQRELGAVTSLFVAYQGQCMLSSHGLAANPVSSFDSDDDTDDDNAKQLLSSVHIWDADTGRKIKSVATNTSAILTARMNVHGDGIICGMADGQIQLLSCPEGFITADNLVSSLAQCSSMDKSMFIERLIPPYTAFQRDSRGNNLIHSLCLHLPQLLQGPWQLLALLEEDPTIALASQECPHERRTLLSLAVDSHNVKLVQAIVTSINTLYTEPHDVLKAPVGLPYYDATDLQKALSVYPREAVEAMGDLWGLTRGATEPLRRRSGDRVMKGAKRARTQVWREEASNDENRVASGWCSSFWSILTSLGKKTSIVAPKPSLPDTSKSPATGAGGDKSSSSTKQLSKLWWRCIWDALTCSSSHPNADMKTEEVDSNKRTSITEGIPMVDWVLCFPGMCTMGPDSFVATCVNVANQLGDTAIFEKPAIQTLLDYKWESYASTYFLILWAISLTLAINLSLYTYYNAHLVMSQRLVWTIFLGINLLPLLFQELLQIYVMRKGPSSHSQPNYNGKAIWLKAIISYFSSIWNVIDAVAYLGLILVMILQNAQPFGKTCYIVSAAVSLLLWLKLLYYFRGFQSTGVLVRAVMEITRDIRFFLVILLVFILGFGNAFYLLSQVDMRHESTTNESLQEAFGSAQDTFKSLFSAMTGGYDLYLFSTSSLSPLPSIMYFIYVVAQAIIMLNLLIAIMGDSYDRVQDKAVGEWRCEQAKIILELEQVLPLLLGKEWLGQWQMPWLHVLMEEGKESGGSDDEWAGRVRTVVRGVNAQVKSEIEEAKGIFKSEVAAMRIESAVIRSELAELKGLVKSELSSIAQALSNIQAQLKSPPP